MDNAAIADVVVEGLHAAGYAIVADALPAHAIEALLRRAAALDAAGAFASAQTGRDTRARDGAVRARGDRIAWLDAATPDPCELPVRALLAALAAACNRALYLGLADDELHYAIYPPGAGYVRHRDRFRDDDARVLSFVLYLNDAWDAAAGGALRLYATGGAVDVMPAGGTVVAFLADSLEHEVLPATRERRSLTGWLRRRSLAR